VAVQKEKVVLILTLNEKKNPGDKYPRLFPTLKKRSTASCVVFKPSKALPPQVIKYCAA
jgi:hypothetical protein